jgi:O-acetyl-ADP-ribose deacetylase (regulator of RNase III)
MKYIKDDIVNSDLEHIAHGCNAQGVMGSGVAKAIRNKWPENYIKYKETFDAFKFTSWPRSVIVGQAYSFNVDNKVIHNLITQEFYGKDGFKYARYIHIVNSIESILMNYNIKMLAIPKIGCGYGGLNWEVVSEILLEFEERYNMEFYVYDIS